MKSKAFITQLLIGIVCVLIVFGLLHQFKVIQLPYNLFLLIFVIVPLIFISGGILMATSFSKAPDVFVNRFMILTTFQFLFVLAILGAVWYKMNMHLKAFGFQFIAVFVALMIVQSILLVKSNKE